jgi:Trk-type K+ transport system membrane component
MRLLAHGQVAAARNAPAPKETRRMNEVAGRPKRRIYAGALVGIVWFVCMALVERFVVHLSWRGAVTASVSFIVLWFVVVAAFRRLLNSNQPPEPRW